MIEDKLLKTQFKTAENQEFELFTRCHFKNLISQKSMEQSVKSNSIKKFKGITSTVHTSPIFQIFFIFLKKDFSENLVNLGF